MRKLLFIISSLLLFACNNNPNNQKKLTEQHQQDIKAIVTSNHIKGIDQINYCADLNFLIGKWKSDIVWEKQTDSTRVGYKFTDMHFECEFTKSRKFNYKIYRNKTLTFETQGEYLINQKNNKIKFVSTINNDSIIEIGDTIRTSIRSIHLLNDSIMRLEEDPSSPFNDVIIQYKKNRP
ncbi:hypothetical protein E9993_17805 [Labilibacter sediminis]|nr:hypothetical protein E9993_17805 [Labilibacter sediminis]